MVDWSGHDGMTTSSRYRLMAERQLADESPSYAQLCRGVADDHDLLARLDGLPVAQRQPNLLLGAVRFLGGPVSSFPAFRSFVLDEWDALAATMLARRTQTNEPRRCASLLPALAAIDGPLALLEVGASAGLCLYPDRYAYRYGDRAVLGHSPVVLDCAVRGPVPVPAALPEVTWRAGLDLDPLDVRNDEDVRWLESLVWPEQTERFALLHAAVEVARQQPAPVHQGDLTTDLAVLARTAPADATLVVGHSAVLAYLDDAQRSTFRTALAELAEHRRVVWLSNEAPGVEVEVEVADGPVPFVLARDGVALALTAPHGQWIEWLG